jgi:hypothetical protein
MLVGKWLVLDLREDTGFVEGHAGWEMDSLRFERGYWLWRGMLVGKWIVLDLREDTGCGGACWSGNG